MSSRIEFGEFWVNDLTIESLNSIVLSAVLEKEKTIVAHHNLHSFYLALRDRKMKEFCDSANYIHADGMLIVFLCKLLGRSISRQNRITYVDWINPLLKICNENALKVFYLGSTGQVALKVKRVIDSKYKKMNFASHTGYFNSEGKENQESIKAIHHFQPDILFVGMGMPRQEHWIYDNFKEIESSVILPCGACFEYIAGEVNTPPRWMGQIGLEWLYRLVSEPKRLFYRYLVEPFILLPYITKLLFNKTK